MKIWNLQLVNLCIAFKTCILYHHTAKHMLPKERLHYFIFHFNVKITKNENFFRENICFSGLEPWKLMQLTIFHLFKRYNFYIRWNFKILKPSWRYVWFNKYHQPPIQYIWTDYTDIQTDYWEKINLILFLLCTKYRYFHRPFYLNHWTCS